MCTDKGSRATPGQVGDSGVYLFVFDVSSECALEVGRLGTVTLSPGTYAYVGSAQRGLARRLARHRSTRKPFRWHIDYLAHVAEPRAALVWPWREGRECELARAIAGGGLGRVAAPWFGASDCRCPGHLLRLGGVHLRELADVLGTPPARLVRCRD
jgi:Uri superfamily endonuclease